MSIRQPAARANLATHPPPAPRGESGLAAEADALERILEAAEVSFREAGYDGAAVRVIADLAGVSKSLVLYHFQSKERLYAAVQTRVYERLARSIRESVDVRGGTVVERGMTALDALIDALREHDDLAANALMGVRALSDERLREQVEALRNELRSLLCNTMRDVIGEGALPVSLEAAADLLWAALAGVGLESVIDGDTERTDRSLAAVRTLIELGLGAHQGEA